MRRWIALALVAWGTSLVAGDPTPARFGRVVTERGAELAVEIAESPAQRERGYMFRNRVGPEDGMLFLFEEEDLAADSRLGDRVLFSRQCEGQPACG